MARNTKLDLASQVQGLLPVANGGTGNGFTKFSGPATSEKTFTLPNASSTIATGTGTTGKIPKWSDGANGVLADSTIGEWTAAPYSSGDFTGNVGTWTVEAGDLTAFSYAIIGKTMVLSIAVDTSSVSGSPSLLRVKIPGGFTANSTVYTQAFTGTGSGLNNTAALISNAGLTYVFFNLLPLGSSTWPDATNTRQCYGSIIFAIQ